MKYKKKRFIDIRIFKRKRGGGKFQFKGGTRHPIAGGSALAIRSIIRAPEKDHAKKKV